MLAKHPLSISITLAAATSYNEMQIHFDGDL